MTLSFWCSDNLSDIVLHSCLFTMDNGLFLQCHKLDWGIFFEWTISVRVCRVTVFTWNDRPQYGVFQYNAIFSYRNRIVFSNDLSSKHDSASCSDGYIPTNGSIGGNIGCGMDWRFLSLVFKYHKTLVDLLVLIVIHCSSMHCFFTFELFGQGAYLGDQFQ